MTTAVQQFAWGPRAGLLWVAGLGLCAGGGMLSWWWVSDEVTPDRQLAPIIVGSAVLLGALANNALLVLRGRRAVGLRLRSLLDGGLAARVETPVRSSDVVLVSVAGRLRFHRIGCPLAVGRRVVVRTRTAHVAAGLQPCGICGADALGALGEVPGA